MSVDLRITTAEVAEGAHVVTLGGELDTSAAPEVERELEQIVSGRTRYLIVDLLEVPFLDSTALGVLLRFSRRLRLGGAEFVLVTDDPRLLRMLEISGLRSQFRIERSLGGAVEDALAKGLH